jgi:hypothetical protein
MAAKKPPIPAPPWTFDALGKETYEALAKEYGFFDPANELGTHRPDLDLTPFYQPAKAEPKEKQ